MIHKDNQDFFQWAVKFEEEKMSNLSTNERNRFLNTLRDKPEDILNYLRKQRRSMKLWYVKTTASAIYTNDLEAFHLEWLEHLKNHFLSQE